MKGPGASLYFAILGGHSARDAYDAPETAVNKLLETKAGDFLASTSIETYD
jgi:hypothetical protein